MVVCKKSTEELVKAVGKSRIATSSAFYKTESVRKLFDVVDWIFTTNKKACYDLQQIYDKVIFVVCSMPVADVFNYNLDKKGSPQIVRYHDLKILAGHSKKREYTCKNKMPNGWLPNEVLVVYDQIHPCEVCISNESVHECMYEEVLKDYRNGGITTSQDNISSGGALTKLFNKQKD